MSKIKILVVDDEEEFRQSTARVLTRRGFEVMEAATGVQCLDLLENDTPDLILLDLKMEHMDGITTLNEIRNRAIQIPVIILTGHGSLKDAIDGIRLNIADFMQKPVDVDILASRIREILDKVAKKPVSEKPLRELMVPVERYSTVTPNMTFRDACMVLRQSYVSPRTGKVTEMGHRAVLVLNKQREPVGIMRIHDFLQGLEPDYLKNSDYASFYTGMVIGQCRLESNLPVSKFMSPIQETISADATLIEALHRLGVTRYQSLPVVDNGKVIGILRAIDVFLEVTRLIMEVEG